MCAAWRRAMRAASRTSVARCSRSTPRSRSRCRCGSGAMAQAGGGRVAHITRIVTMSAAPATVTVSAMPHETQGRRVDRDLAVVFDESQLAYGVHEYVH